GGGLNPNVGLDPKNPIYPDNAAFRSLMSELGVIFAPNVVMPAATRGYGGFNFSMELGLTSVNPKNTANANTAKTATTPPEHYYWRAAESVSSMAFANGNIRTPEAIARMEQELPPTFASTLTVMARKGLWFPVPSFELGAGLRYLMGSKLCAAVVSAKLALHEGFQGWPLPAAAIRGTVSHVFGTSDYHLSVGAADFSLSKHFGVASTFNLTPYAGYQFLWILASSEVVDATPGVDAFGEGSAGKPVSDLTKCAHFDCNAYFAFDPQLDILRHRVFLGLRANFYFASLMLEYSYFLAGRSNNFQNGTEDESGAQHTIGLSLAVDY
ncbi:MAG: hypothetical protein V1754_06975, partial [Pseudomonadota bacterium]